MGRVIHFELPIDNAERATNFYRGVFGWTIQKWDGPVDYWLVGTGESQPGIDGAFIMRSGAMTHTTNTIEVSSLDDAVAKVRELGGTVLEATARGARHRLPRLLHRYRRQRLRHDAKRPVRSVTI